jgi:hypothetical protein
MVWYERNCGVLGLVSRRWCYGLGGVGQSAIRSVTVVVLLGRSGLAGGGKFGRFVQRPSTRAQQADRQVNWTATGII